MVEMTVVIALIALIAILSVQAAGAAVAQPFSQLTSSAGLGGVETVGAGTIKQM